MKEFFKRLLKEKNVYEYFKYSWPFRLYEYIFKPQVIRQHRKEVDVYQSFLPKCKLIFDIGAYDGHKTAAFLEIARKVVCCEPDPINFRLLGIRFRNFPKRVQIHQLAVADNIGVADYFINQPGSAFNTLNTEWKQILEADNLNRWNEKMHFSASDVRKTSTTTLDDLIMKYGLPDFVKIDVEGFEKKVIMGLSQPLPCLSFECLLPEFREDLLYILHRLQAMQPEYRFNIIYHETLLLETFVEFKEIMDWVDHTSFYSFDIVAKWRAKPPVFLVR